MLVYLVFVCYIVFVFFSSFGKKTTMAKVINISGIIVGTLTIYYVFSEDLTDSVLFNILLCIIPTLGALICLLDVTDKKDRKQQPSQPNQQAPLNENVISNPQVSPTYTAPATAYNTAPIQPTNPISQEEEESDIVEYDNITSSAGLAKATGTKDAFNISVYRNNVRYVFTIVDGQMVSYKTPTMKSEKKYEGVG